MVAVEVFSTHPIWFSAFFSIPASPCLRLNFQLNFQPESTYIQMWGFKGGDGWGFFNSSNLVFSLLFNSGQPMFKVKLSIEFATQSKPMFRREGLKVVTVEVLSTHPIWFSAFFSTLASPCLRLSSQLNFQTKTTHVYMWPFKGGDGWGFFNSSNLKFQLIFNSGQPMFKVEFLIEFSTEISPCLNVRV